MSLHHTLRRKASSFRRYPAWVKAWFLPVCALLGLARVLIVLLPFARLSSSLGVAAGTLAWAPLLAEEDRGRARQIGQVIQLAARQLPWRTDCLPQAVVARWLLGWYGLPYVLFFGMRREPGSDAMQAHAWVVSGPVRVTGGHGFGHYAVVGSYVSPTLRGVVKP